MRPDGRTVNTHFLDFDKPMGLAVDGNRLFVGTQTGVREFRNVPDVAKRLAPPNRNDAVYVFRNHYVTGNIDIHEMALGANTNAGSSTRAFHACARSTTNIAFGPDGDRVSLRGCRRKIAAI